MIPKNTDRYQKSGDLCFFECYMAFTMFSSLVKQPAYRS
jgi:hypothetical protein